MTTTPQGYDTSSSSPDVEARRNRRHDETEQELARLRRELSDVKDALAQLSQPDEGARPTSINGEQLSAAISSLDKQVGEIRGLLERPSVDESGPKDLVFIRRLMDVGISEPHAEELSRRLGHGLPDGTLGDGDFRETLQRMLADDLVCGGELTDETDRRRIMAFVGPTGVGKTTTIAKVASQARMMGQRVALVTVDTFRMAAVEQLARYAEVLNAPLRIARTPDDLKSTLDELDDFDLILVDTTGRSPRARDQVDALKHYFPSGWGGELVLTLSCGAREGDLCAAIDAYSGLGLERICLTKTDETHAMGSIYSAVRRAGRPLTWTTFGQKVPDDIEVANPEKWAQRIVAELSYVPRVALAG